MTSISATARCNCGHPRGEHTIAEERCAVPGCSCRRFTEHWRDFLRRKVREHQAAPHRRPALFLTLI